jgi:hypothetical protein
VKISGLIGRLYEARKNVHPQTVHGKFHRLEWAILVRTGGL